ncbi:CD48 antigen [Elephas maximus indicus]|uniref:CD48 antigen n=1 Tax=Elephas maximus indicus TaxID=99487 RepID=UPI0021162F0B|nr:CD48 antigen [Elephas maximus indicus]
MCSRGQEWYLALQLLLLPQLFLITSFQACSAHKMIVVTGSNVSLHVPEPGNYKKFTWIYGTDQKIVEQDEGNIPEYFKLQGRAHLDDHGTLHIYTVQESDSGTYTLQVLNTMGVEREWKFLLAVHNPVSQPDINIKKEKEVNNTCYLQLLCETPDKPVSYTWYEDSRPIQQKPQNAVIEITHKRDRSKFYTCQVNNTVSSNNKTIEVATSCTLVQSSGVTWIATWLVGMVPVVLSLLLT